ncbi:MAG: LysR family transcriptional regulator [Proteobacteria bacterium]|nr:LysR family transcriptional regulator [Pseudomonadota bacterium]MBU4132230.1 LysR family transcriptional regulator [Pseudomonadota bacterium]
MEFRQLKTFRAVADDQSFTRAAQKLFMAQSSVSAQIKALEQELDVRLFDRIGRRVLITDAGSTLYEYARRMEDMTKEIRSEVSGSSQTRGSLTIRIPETLAAIYMPQIVEDFHGHHPEVKLIFINCSDQKLREELNSGRIDLAFLMTDAVYFKEVNVRLLKTEKLIMVSGPSHPFVGRKRVTYPDLSNQTLLLPKTD